MNIVNYITDDLIPGLRKLWQDAFGDEDAFVDMFFGTGFAPERGRCIVEDGKVVAALYWFDTFCQDQKLAYIYAVATDPDYRNRGLCRMLMEDTRSALRARGYAGMLLVPVREELARMYSKMGFESCTTVNEFWCGAQIPAAPIHKTDSASYAMTRRALLPRDGVIQEGENMTFLDAQATFYTGPGFAAAVAMDGENLHCCELLGDPEMAPGILMALGCSYGFFRCPGPGREFSMLCPLTQDCPKPSYFGLAFD